MSDHDRTPQHKHCAEGWICEKHPWLPWPHADPADAVDGECAGPGMPCAALEQLLKDSEAQLDLARGMTREHAARTAERFAQGADEGTAGLATLIATAIRAGDSQHYLPRRCGRPSLGPVTVT